MSASAMRIVVRDAAGLNDLDLAAWPHVKTYNGSNQILTDSVTDGIHTWTQTYTYTSGNLTGLSGWVKVS